SAARTPPTPAGRGRESGVEAALAAPPARRACLSSPVLLRVRRHGVSCSPLLFYGFHREDDRAVARPSLLCHAACSHPGIAPASLRSISRYAFASTSRRSTPGWYFFMRLSLVLDFVSIHPFTST